MINLIITLVRSCQKSKYQCGFRKGFSTQHCLLAMIEKLRKSLDRDSAALLTDLSKAFNCLLSALKIQNVLIKLENALLQ